MATAADLVTLQQQIRQELAGSLQRVREEMHTAVNGSLYTISSISSAMQRISAGPTETANPYRISDWSDWTPKSWDGSHEKGQFRNFMAELHLWMQAWPDQGKRVLVRVESVDKRLNTGCMLHESRLQNIRNRSVPGLTQGDNKRTTEDGSTRTGTERI